MEVFSSHWIIGSISFKHQLDLSHTSMAELIKSGYQLRFLIIDNETHVLSFLTGNGVGKKSYPSNSDRSSWFSEVSSTIRIRFGLERTLTSVVTSVQFDKFGSIFFANNITVHRFFLFFLSVPAHTSYEMGILMHVGIEDLSGDACEFDNVSNGSETPSRALNFPPRWVDVITEAVISL